MKRLFALILVTFAASSSYAQASEAPSDYFWNEPMFPMFLLTAFVFVVVLLVGLVTIHLVRILNMFTAQAENENALKTGIVYKPKPNWWDRFSQQMNASVALENEKEIELHHAYDGIKELDNHLPPWWKWLFYGTVAWSVIYIIVFHLSDALPLQLQEYEHELVLAEEQARKLKASTPEAQIDVEALSFSHDPEMIEKGKVVFIDNNCSACHRSDGGGNTIGPNLTDEFWLHGGDIKQVFNTVKNGVVDKGMPAWGKAMSPQDVRNVTFYILSIQGSNPANAKAPQGEVFKRVTVSDSVRRQAAL